MPSAPAAAGAEAWRPWRVYAAQHLQIVDARTTASTSRTMSMASSGTRQILYADRLESAIGTLLIIHDREGHARALDFHDFESRMRRLLRLHYGAEGREFAAEDRAAPTTSRRALGCYRSRDLWANHPI